MLGNSGELRVMIGDHFAFYVSVDMDGSNVIRARYMQEMTVYAENDPSLNEGTVELYFDYEAENLDVYINTVHRGSFYLPMDGSPSDYEEIQLSLTSTDRDGEKGTKCHWSYAFFDNIVVEVEDIPEEEIPEFSTIAVPVAVVVGMLAILRHRKSRKE